MTASRVLTLTMNPTVDVSMSVAELLPENKSRAVVQSVVGGGGGLNVSRCLLRLGERSLALYTRGGYTGARLQALLDAEGFEHVAVWVAQETREAILLADRASGRTHHIVPDGPRLTDDEVTRCLADLGRLAVGREYVVLTGSLPPGVGQDFWVEAVRAVKRCGAKAILDVAGPALPAVVAEGAFLVRLDRTEGARVLGRPVVEFDDALAAAQVVLEAGPTEYAVATVGPRGTTVAHAQRPDKIQRSVIHPPPLPGPFVSDACGGDSLIAATTYRLLRRDDVVTALAYGVAAAAATVTHPGANIFTNEEVEALAPLVRVEQLS